MQCFLNALLEFLVRVVNLEAVWLLVSPVGLARDPFFARICVCGRRSLRLPAAIALRGERRPDTRGCESVLILAIERSDVAGATQHATLGACKQHLVGLPFLGGLLRWGLLCVSCRIDSAQRIVPDV